MVSLGWGGCLGSWRLVSYDAYVWERGGITEDVEGGLKVYNSLDLLRVYPGQEDINMKRNQQELAPTKDIPNATKLRDMYEEFPTLFDKSLNLILPSDEQEGVWVFSLSERSLWL